MLKILWNVIKGDMSLIGYRPERDYFIEKIEQVFPLYSLLYGIRPGITSQGMVNYGYAENVDEMLERLGEDMDYLRKLTVKPIRQDLKVMLKTVQVVFRGLGKYGSRNHAGQERKSGRREKTNDTGKWKIHSDIRDCAGR